MIFIQQLQTLAEKLFLLYASRNKTENLVQRDVVQSFKQGIFLLSKFISFQSTCVMQYRLCMLEKYGWPAAVFTKLTFSTTLCLYLV
jgi:hypothetical protein